MRAALTVAFLGLTLVACEPPSEAGVLGEWEGEEGGRVMFHPDHTFEVFDLPPKRFVRRVEEPFDSHGEWEFYKEYGSWRIRMVFETIPGSDGGYSNGAAFMVGGSGDDVLLWATEDPDWDRSDFHRVE